jgi:RimJ/RimL family protein N-acetyltransferase
MRHAFLIGEKIYLRTLEREDLNEIYLSWLNDYEVTRYLSSGIFPTSKELLQSYFDSVASDSHSVMFAIIEKESDRHIGNIKISNINWINRTAEIGRMIGEKDTWGKGYGLEALKLTVDYCFKRLNLHKVIAGTVVDNIAPQKNYERLGFKVEGRFREHVLFDGKYRDTISVAILRDEWKF